MTLIGSDLDTQIAFSIFENKGVFALLLGSGLARAAEIPTGWEITLDLIRRVGLLQGETEQSDWASWYRSKTGEEPNYSALLAELTVSPDERRSILHSYIEPSAEDRKEGRKVPTKAHLAIADLVSAGYIRVIITTNFDRLIESALRDRGVEPTIVYSPDALAGAEPLTHTACYVLKLHGDYKDARILNTDAELNAYPPDYDRLLDRIFDEHGLIVVGWSGEWDHALRSAFLRAPNRRYPIYWAARGELGERAQELVNNRCARVVPIADADSFFTGLQRRVATLMQTQWLNPLSVELLIRSTKRLLAKPEYRIELDELVTEQVDRAVTRLGELRLDFRTWSQDEFRRRVSAYEAIIESLARMTGLLGRWGDGGELAIVLDTIRTLCAEAEQIRGGLIVSLSIRSYPATVVFTAYGLALTRAERWNVLHQFFAARVGRQQKDDVPLIEVLYGARWSGDEHKVWNQLDGLEKHKTAFSEHLFRVFADWSKSFLGLVPDFELLFERFEFLAALSYLESTPESELKMALTQPGIYNYMGMPVGRIGWDASRRTRLVSEMQTEGINRAILESGFAHGNEQYFAHFVTNLNRIAGRMDWP